MTANSLAIRNVRVPGREGAFDLLVAEGVVRELTAHDPAASHDGHAVIDGREMLLMPALTDAHTHLREPGQEWKEDIASGLAAAAAGGFSNIMCMANTDPVNDTASVTRFMLRRAAESWPNGPRLFPIGALTVGLRGKELAPMGELLEAGCVAFSNDGEPVADTEIFRRALEYAADLAPVIDHCEDPYMAKGSGANEGAMSARLGLRGQPDAAEAIQAARDILLAEYLGVHVHLAHISCRKSVGLIADAKKRGVKVTAETCPHYLLMTDAALLGYDSLAKVNPPLRTDDDRLALVEALREGVIDILATDHAPHAAHEKETPFENAKNGISGLDTALAALWELVRQGRLSPEDIVTRFAWRPAEIFKLPVNRFAPGDPADFLLFDPEDSWVVTPEALRSKGKNTPLLGQPLTGRVALTAVGGVVVHDRIRPGRT
ncbi:dihydroorotase, multifunctional complex type [Solidesulfovibrio fructosivorans JJ]]|uniref:Dihydroorotase n=1 Tax=Solidesulfovibrio fructosivorans JJ] TaxID=596151 RepID=E1JV47_SOLFR|nr:dihydroorotase [Solidesulfovibrio fructosivorans]EFL51641.1 dihydroorotase, multifunctional complex type [Solidesulfovibrio fructosivorans JJ]]